MANRNFDLSPDLASNSVNDINNWSVAIQSLGLDCITRHIFLCADASKPKCADREASLESWEYLKRRLQELKLDRPPIDRDDNSSGTDSNCIFRTKANCLRLCQKGPIMVIYPDGVWYHSVSPDVIEQIIQQHLLCNKVVEEFVLLQQPLRSLNDHVT